MEIGNISGLLSILSGAMAIAAIVLTAIIVKKGNKLGPIGVSIFALLLCLAALICAIIAYVAIEDYDDHARNVYSWTAFGLACGAIVFGAVSILVAIHAMKNKKEEVEMVVEPNEPVVNGNYVLLSASANVGTGLWTSICVACAAILGVESKNYTKKMERANKAVKARLLKQMSNYPDFVFEDFRIVRDGNLAYTGTVIGTRK